MAINSSDRQGSFWPNWEGNKLFTLLLGILLVYGIVFIWTKTRESMYETNHIGVADREPPTISVSATDSASAVPDIATVDIGYTVIADTASKAQTDNSSQMNALILAVKALGIDAKDIKTSTFDVSPQYDYSNAGPARITGYQAIQNITVRIRDSAKVTPVLDKARELSATNVSGLRFEVDDTTSVEAEARKKAIAKAYAQALSIADAMGARLGAVVSYSEYHNGGPSPIPYMFDIKAEGMGGAAPVVSAGENETSLTVNINFVLE